MKCIEINNVTITMTSSLIITIITTTIITTIIIITYDSTFNFILIPIPIISFVKYLNT